MTKGLKIVLFVLFFLQYSSFSQFSFQQLKVETGLNRAGLFFDSQIGFVSKNHTLSAGIILYGPNIVFENNIPGLIGAYSYKILSKPKFYLSIGLAQSLLYDRKKMSKLWFFNSAVNIEPNFKLANNWDLSVLLGTGIISNLTYPTTYKPEKNGFIYMNYEIAFGIKYHWSTFTNK